MTSQLKIVSTCKPFVGEDAIRQRNAIRSWVNAAGADNVVLVGDEEGVAETCATFGIANFESVERLDGRLPSLRGVLECPLLDESATITYVNADIILPTDFVGEIEAIAKTFTKFMIVGERWSIRLDREISDLELNNGSLAEFARREGHLPGPHWIDYFVFPNRLLGDIPPLTVSGYLWDHWLVGRALENGASVIDATNRITAIHQEHRRPDVSTAELRRSKNLMAIPKSTRLGTIANSTHVIGVDGRISRARSKKYLLGRALRLLTPFVRATRPIRVRLGLTLDNLFRIARRLRRR